MQKPTKNNDDKISVNEKRLNNLNIIVNNLDKDLTSLEKSLTDYKLLNKYYGSKEWFRDKENFEKGKIKNLQAGVLSEDAIWNLDENIADLINRMDNLIRVFNNGK